MAVTIRPLAAADEAQWKDLWTGYLAFYATTAPDEVYETTFLRLLDPACPAQSAFVAEAAQGHLVGLVHTITHPHNWRIEDVVYLQDLFVAPEARGIGVGRALIEAVYEAADANGTPSVYWLTQDFNTEARRLYDRLATLTPFIKYQR